MTTFPRGCCGITPEFDFSWIIHVAEVKHMQNHVCKNWAQGNTTVLRKRFCLQLSCFCLIGFTFHCKYHSFPFIDQSQIFSRYSIWKGYIYISRVQYMKGSIAVWWKEDISDQTFRKLENIWDIFSFFSSKMWWSQKVLRSFLICKENSRFSCCHSFPPYLKNCFVNTFRSLFTWCWNICSKIKISKW